VFQSLSKVCALPSSFIVVLRFAIRSDEDDKKSTKLAAKTTTSYEPSNAYHGNRSRPYDPRRVAAGVATVDVEFDAPDDVVGVVRGPTAEVPVQLDDTYDLQTRLQLCEASLDRLAAERAARRTQSCAAPPSPVVDQPCEPVCEPVCEQPCAEEQPCSAPCVEPCPVVMAAQPCDPSPEVRCARSLQRIGVTCPASPCDDDVCPLFDAQEPAQPPPPAAPDYRRSMINEFSQTEKPAESSVSGTSHEATTTAGYDGAESETDFDPVYSDEHDQTCRICDDVSCCILEPAFHQSRRIFRHCMTSKIWSWAPTVLSTPFRPSLTIEVHKSVFKVITSTMITNYIHGQYLAVV